MKILILADYFSQKKLGGATIVSLDEALLLAKKGHEVTVITATPNATEIGVTKEDGITVHRLYSNYAPRWRAYMSIYNPQVISKIKRLIREIRPDVIHAQSIHTFISYYALKLAKQSGARVFITMHDVMAVHYGKFTEFIDRHDLSVPKKFNYRVSAWKLFKTFRWRFNPLRNILIRHYLRYADRIFAVSGALKEFLAVNGIHHVEVVYNGLPPETWHAPATVVEEFRRRHGLNGKKVILFSGWVTAAKGGEELLQAFLLVRKAIPEAVIVAVGRTDRYYEYMKQSVARLGLEKQVIFIGWAGGQDLVAANLAADVVVFPSVCFDTFGMVSLEGMLSRKPVIATCFGGSREVVEDGVTGYIVNPYNAVDMSNKIMEMLRDTTKAKAFGETGYERAVRLFDKNDKVAELESWYSRPLS